MNRYVNKTKEKQRLSHAVTSKEGNGGIFQFADNRSEVFFQRKQQEIIHNSNKGNSLPEVSETDSPEDRQAISATQKEVQEEKLKDVEVLYTEESNNEKHKLYFDYLDGHLTLFRASTPMPFIKYLNKMDTNHKKWGKAFWAIYNKTKYYYEDVDRLLRNYDDDSIKIANALLIQIANVLRTNTSFQEKDGDDIKQKRPLTIIAPLGYQHMQTASGENLDRMTLGIHANPLSIIGEPGSIPFGWNTLGAKLFGQDPQVNMRGHLLNHLLHGSGKDWHNIALITEDINTKTQEAATSPESVAKWEVIGNNHVIDFKVEVRYNRDQRYEGTYENYLASELFYTIKRKKLTKGKDGSSAGDWAEDAADQPPYIPSYSWDIPYTVDNALIENGGKFDKRKAMRSKIKSIRSATGDSSKLLSLEGRIDELRFYKKVKAFREKQGEIMSELNGIDKSIDVMIDGEIKKRWPENFLAKWKEEEFRKIDLNIDGSSDVNSQLSEIYTLLDEKPLNDEFSNDNMLCDAKEKCRLHLSSKGFPEHVLEDILKKTAAAIEDLGARIALEREHK